MANVSNNLNRFNALNPIFKGCHQKKNILRQRRPTLTYLSTNNMKQMKQWRGPNIIRLKLSAQIKAYFNGIKSLIINYCQVKEKQHIISYPLTSIFCGCFLKSKLERKQLWFVVWYTTVVHWHWHMPVPGQCRSRSHVWLCHKLLVNLLHIHIEM